MQLNETKDRNLGPRNVNVETFTSAFSDFVNTAEISCRKYISAMDWYVKNAKQHTSHNFKTNKTPNKIAVCVQTNSWVKWLRLLGSKFFNPPKNESALVGTSHLVKDCSQKAGSIRQRSLTKLAPGHDLHTSISLCHIFAILADCDSQSARIAKMAFIYSPYNLWDNCCYSIAICELELDINIAHQLNILSRKQMKYCQKLTHLNNITYTSRPTRAALTYCSAQ